MNKSFNYILILFSVLACSEEVNLCPDDIDLCEYLMKEDYSKPLGLINEYLQKKSVTMKELISLRP